MRIPFRVSCAALAAAGLLAACGGGGGGGSGGFFPVIPAPAPTDPGPAPDPAPSAMLKGTSTAGGATLTAHCASGAVATGTAAANGEWSITLGSQVLPCVIQATGGNLPAGESLYSLVTDAGTSVGVNPLTNLLIAKAAAQRPADWLDAQKASLPDAVAALKALLADSGTELEALLTEAGYTLDGIPSAAFDGSAQSQFDSFFARLALSLENAAMKQSDLDAVVSDAGATVHQVPYTRSWTNADVAAQPQLNEASLAITSGTLSMTTGTSTSPVGTYVGGGTGNKAVLQLPGLNGLKVKDFKGIEIEWQADPNYASTPTIKPYVSFDFVIDMQCGAPALGNSATLEDARVRYRTVTYDSYYQLMQPGGSLLDQVSGSEFRIFKLLPSTGGWRSSTGIKLGLTERQDENPFTGNTPFDINATELANACFIDTTPGDGGMFRSADASCASAGGLPTTAPASCGGSYRGAYLFVGSSGNVLASTWQVKSLKYNAGLRSFAFD